jgi:hypothetical protein
MYAGAATAYAAPYTRHACGYYPYPPFVVHASYPPLLLQIRVTTPPMVTLVRKYEKGSRDRLCKNQQPTEFKRERNIRAPNLCRTKDAYSLR